MRYTILVVILATSACTVDVRSAISGLSVAEVKQGLICDPDCDPAGASGLINFVLSWGGSVGWHTTMGDAGCQWQPVPAGYFVECYATFESDTGHRYLVDCTRSPLHVESCSAVDACDQFGC